MFPKYFVYCAEKTSTVSTTIAEGASDEGGHYQIDCLDGMASPSSELVYQAGCGTCFNQAWSGGASVVCTRQDSEGAVEQVVIDNVGD